jgi:acylphosphatase
VKNLPDSTVELVAEGPEPLLQDLVEWLKVGPPLAKVSAVDEEWLDATNEFSIFEIKRKNRH